MKGQIGNVFTGAFLTLLVAVIVASVIFNVAEPITTPTQINNESWERTTDVLHQTTYYPVHEGSLVINNLTNEGQTFEITTDYNVSSYPYGLINMSHKGNFTAYYQYEQGTYITDNSTRTTFNYLPLIIIVVIIAFLGSMVMLKS